MKPINGQQRAEILDNVLSLAVGCPVDHCNPADCPLAEIRQLELGKRLEWLKSLSDDELVYLNSYHYICLKTKLEAHLLGTCR